MVGNQPVQDTTVDGGPARRRTRAAATSGRLAQHFGPRTPGAEPPRRRAGRRPKSQDTTRGGRRPGQRGLPTTPMPLGREASPATKGPQQQKGPGGQAEAVGPVGALGWPPLASAGPGSGSPVGSPAAEGRPSIQHIDEEVQDRGDGLRHELQPVRARRSTAAAASRPWGGGSSGAPNTRAVIQEAKGNRPATRNRQRNGGGQPEQPLPDGDENNLDERLGWNTYFALGPIQDVAYAPGEQSVTVAGT